MYSIITILFNEAVLGINGETHLLGSLHLPGSRLHRAGNQDVEGFIGNAITEFVAELNNTIRELPASMTNLNHVIDVLGCNVANIMKSFNDIGKVITKYEIDKCFINTSGCNI